ncbi:hypothetical protein KBD81_00925 [Candidatus Woesebacteria bacterium]|nr:hypothetical protein [Candidatus Woesebacteria bacterium]
MNSAHNTNEPQLDSFQAPTVSKFSNKMVLVALGFVLLVVGTIGGWYMGKTTQTAQTNQITPSPIPSPEAGDEMEEWKIFVSKYNNFSFEYPLGYILEDRQNYSSLLSPLDPTPRKGYAVSDKELKIEIVVSESGSSDSLEKWVLEEKAETEGSIEEVGTTNIDGVEAIILKSTGLGVAEVYLAIHDTKRYMILKYPFTTSLDEKFNQILSTFKFADKAQELNTVSGKLCYPSEYLPQGNIVAKDIETKELFTQKYPGSENGGKSTFDMELPDGTYVFRYEAMANENKPDEFLAGYYTQCATITDRGCTDAEHQLSQVQVPNQSENNISLCDFYYTAEPDF